MPITRRLSQRISEGDGISIIVCVDDAGAAQAAEAQGAEAVAVTAEIDGIRGATNLPLLWLGTGAPSDADAVRIRPDDDSEHDHLEAVVDVRDEEELELALERLDPEIFLLNAHDIDEDVDPLDAVLELLPGRAGGQARDRPGRGRDAATRCSPSSGPASTRCSSAPSTSPSWSATSRSRV